MSTPGCSSALRKRRISRTSVCACVIATAIFGSPSSIYAAISSAGDIAPVPPVAGGAVVGLLHIGDVDVATMTITTSGGVSPLTNTNSVLIGETVTGIGIVNMSGFGSDWTRHSERRLARPMEAFQIESQRGKGVRARRWRQKNASMPRR